MAVINEAWAELTGLSSPKLNAMTIVAYTGAEISALTSTAVEGQIVYCYSTGSGYTIGHWYAYDGSIWQDIIDVSSGYDFLTTHNFLHNTLVVDKRSSSLWEYMDVNSGTGSSCSNVVSDNSAQYISLNSGTTTTGYAAIYSGGIQCDWGQPMTLKVKFRTPTPVTGQIAKLGVNIDRAGLGPSTRRNIGVEWCDGDSSFQVHSGNGSAQSNFDTGITVTADAIWQIDMSFDPGNELVVDFDDGTTVTQKIKTTNIPSSGNTTSDGLMKFSISNNNGSTTNSELEIHSAYLVCNTADSWWT